MPLGEPPAAAGSLADLPTEPVAGRTLQRVWRFVTPDGTVRHHPWWFASTPDDPADGGRFDLPAPMGTCYTATSPVAAVLEALQARLVNLPIDELRVRRRAEIVVPDGVPAAAKLTARELAGRHGVTAALWAGGERALTQRWAAALRRDGWWLLYAGVQHDPSGQLRMVAVFDQQGAHPPTLDGEWTHSICTLHDDGDLHEQLAGYGVTVREPATLPWATLDDRATE